MLPGNLLPGLLVYVAIDDGLGDRESLQFLQHFGLWPDYLSLDAGYRLYSTWWKVGVPDKIKMRTGRLL
jgi:hypothetical protein